MSLAVTILPSTWAARPMMRLSLLLSDLSIPGLPRWHISVCSDVIEAPLAMACMLWWLLPTMPWCGQDTPLGGASVPDASTGDSDQHPMPPGYPSSSSSPWTSGYLLALTLKAPRFLPNSLLSGPQFTRWGILSTQCTTPLPVHLPALKRHDRLHVPSTCRARPRPEPTASITWPHPLAAEAVGKTAGTLKNRWPGQEVHTV